MITFFVHHNYHLMITKLLRTSAASMFIFIVKTAGYEVYHDDSLHGSVCQHKGQRSECKASLGGKEVGGPA